MSSQLTGLRSVTYSSSSVVTSPQRPASVLTQDVVSTSVSVPISPVSNHPTSKPPNSGIKSTAPVIPLPMVSRVPASSLPVPFKDAVESPSRMLSRAPSAAFGTPKKLFPVSPMKLPQAQTLLPHPPSHSNQKTITDNIDRYAIWSTLQHSQCSYCFDRHSVLTCPEFQKDLPCFKCGGNHFRQNCRHEFDVPNPELRLCFKCWLPVQHFHSVGKDQFRFTCDESFKRLGLIYLKKKSISFSDFAIKYSGWTWEERFMFVRSVLVCLSNLHFFSTSIRRIGTNLEPKIHDYECYRPEQSLKLLSTI